MNNMRFRHALFLLLFCVSFAANAYELITIQAVSDTKKTFITRNGKRMGLIPGMTGTFTAEDISILAKAVTVTGTHAQWQVINTEAIMPWEKGAIVTYYPATEYIWALSPETERRKYIKSNLATLKRSWVFKGGFGRGLNESVSDSPATSTSRGGLMAEVYYEKDFAYGLAWDIGVRYEQETINYPGATFVTKRNLLIGDIIYYFYEMQDYLRGKFFLAAGIGYGLSNTQSVGISQTGPVGLLPTARIGASLPFSETWEFITDAGFESLQTSEEQESGKVQTTTQTNFKFGFGLRRFY